MLLNARLYRAGGLPALCGGCRALNVRLLRTRPGEQLPVAGHHVRAAGGRLAVARGIAPGDLRIQLLPARGRSEQAVRGALGRCVVRRLSERPKLEPLLARINLGRFRFRIDLCRASLRRLRNTKFLPNHSCKIRVR